MYYELKKIDLWSAIKVSFVINAVIGLVIGVLIGLVFACIVSFVGHMVPSDSSELANIPFGALGGFFVGMIYALILAIFNGVILTSIVVVLYNVFAGWLGGIKLDCRAVEPEIGQPTMTIAANPDQQTGGQV
jgi:predicted membrane-bound spermidine synthase